MNQEQYETLKRSAGGWNKWRKANPDVQVDLTSADFSGYDLRFANLQYADLRFVNLQDANASQCQFQYADLCAANLSSTRLAGADFTGANLSNAYFIDASAEGCVFVKSNCFAVDFSGATVTKSNFLTTNVAHALFYGTDFDGAYLGDTLLADVCLTDALNLESILHVFPSTLGTNTLERSRNLPELFLRGCGLTDELIQYLPSLLGSALEFYSCFISYSHADKSFARRLHDTLEGRGIRCWLDEHQLLPGDPIAAGIDEGIRIYDKVLLCCSENSIKPGVGWWVDKEITKAFAKEERLSRERGNDVFSLIPLNLDGYIHKSEHPWKSELRGRIMPDFTCWATDNAKFEEELEPLIQALRADAGARLPHPKPKL